MGTGGADGFQALPGKCQYRVAPAVTSRMAALTTVVMPMARFVAEPRNAARAVFLSVTGALDDSHKRGPPTV